MSGLKSRNKGKEGERELAAFLTAYGFPSQRAQQFKGGQHSEDIWSPELRGMGLHLECKRVETARIPEWLDKAELECEGTDKEPAIFWRKNRGDWIAILPAHKLLQLLRKSGE